MAKTTLPASSVEMPPNKAIAAPPAIAVGSMIVALALHYLDPNASPEIVTAWTGLVNAILATAAVYLTPHGAVVKE